MPDYEHEKKLAAQKAIELIEDRMVVGLGSGTTSSYFIDLLGERVRRGLKIQAIPTSNRSGQLAEEVGVPLTSFDNNVDSLDITVDGTDEFDSSLALIKGGGGALLREKIVASASKKLVIIADSGKRVDVLGRFPLPVEVTPFGWQITSRRIERLGAIASLRLASSGDPFKTAENNYILDCRFESIRRPRELAEELDSVVGVVEHGLFTDLVDVVIMGCGDSVEILEASPKATPWFPGT